MTKGKIMAYMLPVAVVAIIVAVAFGKRNDGTYQKDTGFIFGTSYNVTYESGKNYKKEIVDVLNEVDRSLSPFNDSSIITAVNNNKDTELNTYFTDVFTLADKICKDTQGAFDITVAPLVNAWGFGFKNGTMPTQTQIDSIKSFVGFNHVTLTNGKIHKDDPRTMLDCSAIAKGYGVDKVAELLEAKGIKNYMVEIGGEIIVKGVNPEKKNWHIAVIKPTDDSLSTSQEMQTILKITDIAMATSGNYRNYYYKDGKKYAHTIDPKTGRPVQHNILSATVLAPTCAQADAYATSFMVSGLDKAKQILSRHKEMMAYIIYNDEKGKYSVWYSPAMKKHIGN